MWTGEQAVTRGLVDELGGLRVAVAKAKEKVGIDRRSRRRARASIRRRSRSPSSFDEALRVTVALSVAAALPWSARSRRVEPWLDAIAGEGRCSRRRS